MDNFEKFTIQTYDDQKERHDSSLAHTFLYNSKRIKELNDKGAAICFVLNPQLKPDSHSISNTAALQYISLDLDVAKIEHKISKKDIAERKTILLDKIKLLSIQPNYIVETKHGYQPIWELAMPIALHTEDSRQQMNARYKDLIRGFTANTNLKSEGDSISRVIRLPKTHHLKDPNHPFLIKIFKLNLHKVTLEDLEKAYPPIKKEVHIYSQNRQFSKDPIINKIINYPVKEALTKLSGRKEVNYEKFDFKHNSNGTVQILVNGKVTGQWIDCKNRTIGGPGKGQGNPTVIQFLRWYGVNYRNEDEITATIDAIRALRQILEIPNEVIEHTYKKNDYEDTNKYGGRKDNVNFELTPRKLQILKELKRCRHTTPRNELSSFIEEFFKEWGMYSGYCKYVAETWNPRAIWRVIEQMIKRHNTGRTIYSPGGYFTYAIKKRSKRRER